MKLSTTVMYTFKPSPDSAGFEVKVNENEAKLSHVVDPASGRLLKATQTRAKSFTMGKAGLLLAMTKKSTVELALKGVLP